MFAFDFPQVIPEHIHVEVGTFHHPNALHADMIYRKVIDWTPSYTMHIWKRQGHVPSKPEQTNKLNSTLGEVMRHIYYGNKSMVEDGEPPWEYAKTSYAMLMWETLNRFVIT